MFSDEIKNVLVVGAPGREAAKFIKTFGAYLQCSTHEEANKWEPNLTQYSFAYDDIKDITRTTMQIGNKTFNFMHPSSSDDFWNVYASKQVIAILLHYLQKQKLTAIIFLVHPTYSNKYDENGNFKSCLFSDLEQFADNNVLYVCNNEGSNSAQVKEYLEKMKVERNIFYFQENSFFKIAEVNWQQCVEFSKSIYNYIVGNEIINRLPDYYVQSLIPEKCILKYVDDLMMWLVQFYICAEYANISLRLKNYYRFIISNYKTNVSVCYGCVSWMQRENNNVNIKMQIPAVCHVPCKCMDISKCTIFETSNGRCCECDHDIKYHTKNSFQNNITYKNVEHENKKEKESAIKTLSTFYLYKKQNQEEYNVKSICKLLLDMNDSNHSSVFTEFETQFDQAVKKLEKQSNLITCSKLMMCLYEFNRENSTSAILEYIDYTFPKECRLEIIAEPNDSSKHLEIKKECETPNNEEYKMENETLRNENLEIKQMLQNANDLNSKLLQDMHTLTKKRRLDEEDN